ncbi:hypothetical protein KEM54_000976, partial [Ascosphaera aggregata]
QQHQQLQLQSPYSPNVPLSSRVSLPLDLSTVERRGQPNAVKEFVKRTRPFGLREAPTFSPTDEEFRDPLEYIKKIAPEGRKYGICKIIPPEKWNPPFAIDTERFHFRTRKQELNSVDGGTRANLNYLDQLQKFHRQNGMNLSRFPSVDKRPLDLYKLKKAVEERGGFDQVCKLKKWAEIGRDLGYSGKIMSSLSTSLKNSYQRWLHPFEEYLKAAKPAVYRQLECENGGPYTPSPTHSPAKKAVIVNRTRTATNATTTNTTNTSSTSAAQSPTLSNLSPSVNDAIPELHLSRHVDLKNEPGQDAERSTTAPATEIPEGERVSSHKRSSSHNNIDDTDDGGDSAAARRSKRRKRDATSNSTITNISSGGSTTPRTHSSSARCRGRNGHGSENTNGHSNASSISRKAGGDTSCENCGKSDRRTTILICDSCDDGYHMSCLDPPIETAPEHDWHCARCLVGTGEYGFEDGEVYSLREFQEKANKFRRDYFNKKTMPFDPVHKQKRESEDDVETEFWRLLQNVGETIEVEYGADIHCTTHGSAFPTLEKNPLDPYSTDGWNLNVLPLYGESLFKHIKTDISGMTAPWAYVGMMFSTFCWHNEDHYAYSANYQHFGATKTWYGIPGDQTELFEEAMRQHVPELFETQPDLLFQLVTLLPPDRLKKAGVDVYALDQRAGQFVITFPRAYHAGFNHGFNFNEAVNFAPTDWEPWGQVGAERLQEFRRQPCFSHDELLLTAAAKDTSIKTAKWLGPALKRLEKREVEARRGFRARQQELLSQAQTGPEVKRELGTSLPERFVLRNSDLPEEEYQCCYCKVFSYLTQFKCHKSGSILCLSHAETYACCGEAASDKLLGSTHTLYYRMTDNELSDLTQRIVDRAEIPERWIAKLDYVLSGNSKPSLKALQGLVSEGEKIPYQLDGLSDLTEFVAQCNKWVNKATNYITRKQQNRRKNEKAWRRSIGSRSSLMSAMMDDRDPRETRSIDDLRALLQEGEKLSFDCPQITALHEKLDEVEQFQQEAHDIIENPYLSSSVAIEQLIDCGKNLCVTVSEIEKLEELLQQMKWIDEGSRLRGQYLNIDQCRDFIREGEVLGISEKNEHMLHFKDLLCQGQAWEDKATELIRMEVTHYQQLDALSVQAGRIPVSEKTLAEVKAILSKQREAEHQVRIVNEASKHPDITQRPLYKDVRDLMESLAQMNSKPPGFIDLEREKKRHENWMRKGKKLFGKGNAPLHILKMHMQYVMRKNSFCFDLEDQFRPPVEPPSREASPDAMLDAHYWMTGRTKSKDVFCLCRQQESGLMIECGRCHEWYHGKCLKIARGKVKEDDDYVCPICDWRVKIPRDAARPKLEDLLEWQAEIPDLPFQPEEQEILKVIVDQAVAFRHFVHKYTAGSACVTFEELPTMIFYLRKIEGAEILLAYETNYLRQTIHKLNPIADHPPPTLYQSLSTRKPRPTKQQKLMKEHNVDKPEDLPLDVRRQFQAANKRKSTEMQQAARQN